jgi:hypothetical protein
MTGKLDPLSKWFFFTVIPALFPLALLALQLWFKQRPVSTEILFGKGELLLACSAFGAVGLGDLIGSGKRFRGRKRALGGCCFLIVVFAVVEYADIGRMAQQQPPDYNVLRVAWWSVIWCFFALLCGGSCLYMGELK